MNDEVKAQVLEMTNKAISTGRLMIAVWRIEDGQLCMDRLTHDFPTRDLLKASAKLTIDMFAETEAIENATKPPFAPLALADLGDEKPEPGKLDYPGIDIAPPGLIAEESVQEA